MTLAANRLRITVVTPSFNQAQYLEETIQSVLQQRDDIDEYFVIDGGSRDASADIIRKYEDRIDYWVSERDNGQADAIHKGFSRATGDILFWVNSDDVMAPGAAARVRRAFEMHPEWDVLTGYSVFVNHASRITAVNCTPKESKWWASQGVLHVCQQTCYFTKSLYDRVGGIDVSLHCALDTELWLRFFEADARWGHLSAVLGGFRLHGEMKGVTWTDSYERERHIVAARHPWFPTRPVPYTLGRILYRGKRATGVLTGGERWTRPLLGTRLSAHVPGALTRKIAVL
ncbi:MAG: glycosyltransferase family 2 protein [Planctomycetota bacterium]